MILSDMFAPTWRDAARVAVLLLVCVPTAWAATLLPGWWSLLFMVPAAVAAFAVALLTISYLVWAGAPKHRPTRAAPRPRLAGRTRKEIAR